MLDITIIAVGKIKNKQLERVAEDYLKRIKPFARLEIIEVKPASFTESNKEQAKREEATRIEAIIARKNEGKVFLLAEEGIENSSLDFANKLEKINGPIFLIIAGALGWSEELRKKYEKVSLSKLTMPHELARIVLMEQLYRSSLILIGKEYHY